MRDEELAFEKTEILSRFVENLHSSDHDLFDGIEPGHLSRADMDLLDLVLFMVPMVPCPGDDLRGRLWAVALESAQLAGTHRHEVGERTTHSFSRFFGAVAGPLRAAAAFVVALIAEPVPGSLELRSIDTSGQLWYKLHAASRSPMSYGGNMETRYATCCADVFAGFRAVA